MAEQTPFPGVKPSNLSPLKPLGMPGGKQTITAADVQTVYAGGKPGEPFVNASPNAWEREEEKKPPVDSLRRKMGRIEHEDARDALFLTRSHLEAAVAPVIVRRRIWAAPSPMDQGETPQCVGFSSKGFLLAGPVLNPSPTEPPDKIYSQAQALDPWAGTKHEGSTVRAAMKALVQLGYSSGYLWAFSAKDVANWLLSKSPMVFGTTWYESMFEPDRVTGFVKVDQKSGVAGGHAYLIFGCDLDKKCPDGSTGAVCMLNSWGISWGMRGVAWIALNDVVKLLANNGEAACCTEVHKNT